MADVVKFELKGARELERALKEFGPRFTVNVSGRALRAMAKPIVQRARQGVPVGETGRLKKSITAVLHRARPGERSMSIGFKRGRQFASWRAHFIEYGTAHSPAQPFIRPALDEGADAGLSAMIRVLRDGIEAEAKKRGAPSASAAAEEEARI